MRLDRGFRGSFYATLSVLFASGAAWFGVDRLKPVPAAAAWQESATWLLMLHGGSAMVTLAMLGALIPLHVRVAWRCRRNRVTGSVMCGIAAALVATAFGLYYIGSDALRGWASDLHIGIGLGLPILLGVHVVMGRRSARAAARPAAAAAGPVSPC